MIEFILFFIVLIQFVIILALIKKLSRFQKGSWEEQWNTPEEDEAWKHL